MAREITEISPLRTFLGDFLISVHSLSNVRNIKTASMRSEMTPKSLERDTEEIRCFSHFVGKLCKVFFTSLS